MSVQMIMKQGTPEYAVVPYEIYEKLVEDAEMLEDILALRESKNAFERGEEEWIPARVVHAILDGENPIKVWREFRELSRQKLADKVEISTAYLSQLESGKRTGTVEVLVKIARALRVDIDDLIYAPAEDEEMPFENSQLTV